MKLLNLTSMGPLTKSKAMSPCVLMHMHMCKSVHMCIDCRQVCVKESVNIFGVMSKYEQEMVLGLFDKEEDDDNRLLALIIATTLRKRGRKKAPEVGSS